MRSPGAAPVPTCTRPLGARRYGTTRSPVRLNFFHRNAALEAAILELAEQPISVFRLDRLFAFKERRRSRKSEATVYYDLCALSLAVKTWRNDCVPRKQLPVGTLLPRRSLSTEGRRTRDGKLRGHLSAHRGAATYGFSIGFVPGPMVDTPGEERGPLHRICMRQDRLILTMMQHAHRRGPSAHGLDPWESPGRRAHSSSRHIVPCSNTASRHLGSSIQQSCYKPA